MNTGSLFAMATLALAIAVAAAGVDARPGGGGGSPGTGGGGAPGAGSGGSRPGGSWQGGGGGQGRNWQGGSSGYSDGGRNYGAAHYRGGYYGGHYGGGYRGWYGAGFPGWYGGWYGPSLALGFGLPAYWGWPYYHNAWATPSPVYVPDATVGDFAPLPSAPAPVTYWYYCTEPAGYYPYVQSCTNAWIPVMPSTVSPASSGSTPQ